ncbi:MAG: right-handed parallel beta-helix repeat-containing protein [Syntrophomonas sp.]
MKVITRRMPGQALSFLLILLLAGWIFPAVSSPVAAEGNIYYVAKNGSDDNPGTEESPWQTIQKAAASLEPGDTVYIRGGTYSEHVIIHKSGSPGKFIKYYAYPGESVVIDGSGIDWGYDWEALVALSGQSYIWLSGLKVINSRWFGIGDCPDGKGCDNIVVENCSTYNTRSSGIAFGNSSYLTIDGNSVARACSSPSQEAISMSNVDHFCIRYNSVTDSAREGIDAKQGCTNGKIYNNKVRNCGNGDMVARPGIYIDAFSKQVYNIEVFNNEVAGCPQGICVAAEMGGVLKDVNIHHNVISDCLWGLSMGDWEYGYSHDMENIYFTYNTVYNAEDGGIRLQNNWARNVIVANNTFDCLNPIAYISVDRDELTVENNQTR